MVRTFLILVAYMVTGFNVLSTLPDAVRSFIRILRCLYGMRLVDGEIVHSGNKRAGNRQADDEQDKSGEG